MYYYVIMSWEVLSIKIFLLKLKKGKTILTGNRLVEYHFGNRYSLLPSDTRVLVDIPTSAT